jgi:hypothetical protein
VSIEAHSFIIVSLETHHESKASILQVSKSHRMPRFSRIYTNKRTNLRIIIPRKIFPNKQVGYLRWKNIIPECYQILKKKWWKGLVGHLHDRGRYGNFFFLHLISEFFLLFHLISCYFIFVCNSN